MFFIKCLNKLAQKDGVESWEKWEDEDDTAQFPLIWPSGAHLVDKQATDAARLLKN